VIGAYSHAEGCDSDSSGSCAADVSDLLQTKVQVSDLETKVATEKIVSRSETKTQRMHFFLAHFAHILRNISWGQPAPGHVDASLQDKFEDIFNTNEWGSSETRSGFGSTVADTWAIRDCLDSWMTKYNVKFLLDIPCGDGNWQGLIPGVASGAVKYQGYDISPGAVASAESHNQANKNMQFGVLDLVNQVPTEHADLIMVKEVIQHLPLAMGLKMLQNAKAAGIKWLAVTSDPSYHNRDIQPGEWFPGPNAQAPPFNFGAEAERCEKDDFMLFDLDAWQGF